MKGQQEYSVKCGSIKLVKMETIDTFIKHI